MIYGLIIAAGAQTRFKSETPKALVQINGRCLLDINVENMRQCCDEVYVICSYDNYQHFNGKGYRKIIIDSGKGCGDAILKALYCIQPKPHDKCYIQWGDSLQQAAIYPRMKDYYNGKVVIPCVKEDSPYVQIKPTNNSVEVIFSKYNELIEPGYHDLSIFYGDAFTLYNKLSEFMKQCVQKDGTYKHKHGNELQFLDVFNDTNIEGEVMEVDYDSFSFNTVEELEELNGSELR